MRFCLLVPVRSAVVCSRFFVGWCIAIDPQLGATLYAVDWFVTCCFLLDILITFRTGYVDYSGNEIFDARLIAVRFVSSLFVVDALAAFPFHIFSPLIDFGPSAQFVDNCLKVNFLLRASKLINSDRIDSFISPQARISKLLFGFLCLAHFFACLFFFVGSVQSGSDSWILRQGLQLKPHSEQYICARYWSIATMVTVVSRTGDAQDRKGSRRKRERTEEGDEGGRLKGWQPVISEGTDWVCVCARALSRRAAAVAVPISRPHAALLFVSVCVLFCFQGYGDVTPVTVYEQATVIPIVTEQRGTMSCGS